MSRDCTRQALVDSPWNSTRLGVLLPSVGSENRNCARTRDVCFQTIPFQWGEVKQKLGFEVRGLHCLGLPGRCCSFVNWRLRIITLTNSRPEAGWEGRDCHSGGVRATKGALLLLTPGCLLPACMISPADISPEVYPHPTVFFHLSLSLESRWGGQ